MREPLCLLPYLLGEAQPNALRVTEFGSQAKHFQLFPNRARVDLAILAPMSQDLLRRPRKIADLHVGARRLSAVKENGFDRDGAQIDPFSGPSLAVLVT